MTDFTVNPATVPPPQVMALSTTQDAVIHVLVGAQFGDLEFDVGKSVRWAQWFCDDIFITDINTGEQRYWVVNWTESFPEAFHSVTGINYFVVPTEFRKEQFREADAERAILLEDDDWVLFVDAHEGMSCDSRSLPNDYWTEPFRSFVFREITRAEAAGQDHVSIPFFVFLRHVTQTVEYDSGQTLDNPDDPNADPIPLTIEQPVAVPYYLPYQGLKRLWKVSALRAPSFDWSQLDQPSTASAGVKIQLVSYAYAHWQLLDIVPPATTVPPLDITNDDGWRMRKLISRVRPVPAVPFDDAHWDPINDPIGQVGPTGFAQPGSPDPIDGFAPPTPTVQTEGILVPLYDLTFRLNIRDGVWYAGNQLGSVPLYYDNDTDTWKPVVSPEDWHETTEYVAPI